MSHSDRREDPFRPRLGMDTPHESSTGTYVSDFSPPWKIHSPTSLSTPPGRDREEQVPPELERETKGGVIP